MREFKTTYGTVQWDSPGIHVESVGDPSPPDYDNDWTLEGSAMSEMIYSRATILWFWSREV